MSVSSFLPIFFFCWRPADSVMVSFFFSTDIKQENTQCIKQYKDKHSTEALVEVQV